MKIKENLIKYTVFLPLLILHSLIILLVEGIFEKMDYFIYGSLPYYGDNTIFFELKEIWRPIR